MDEEHSVQVTDVIMILRFPLVDTVTEIPEDDENSGLVVVKLHGVETPMTLSRSLVLSVTEVKTIIGTTEFMQRTGMDILSSIADQATSDQEEASSNQVTE